ncbi:hypothetical protein IWZ03DRAFT_384984 [Phyllosticta citriasiana]|uniref:Secreted protein n=1 Tax=Phyllosticta citriasiana TaxID=595635 RepID=A0ABR1KEE9_9PEZI
MCLFLFSCLSLLIRGLGSGVYAFKFGGLWLFPLFSLFPFPCSSPSDKLYPRLPPCKTQIGLAAVSLPLPEFHLSISHLPYRQNFCPVDSDFSCTRQERKDELASQYNSNERPSNLVMLD